jgi:hypothetical protein
LGALLVDPDFVGEPQLDGIIFHMSRCGSTLLARQLGQLPEATVLSEPAPIDELLQFLASQPAIPLDIKAQLLRRMVAALCSERGTPIRYRFIKADGWHTHSIPLFRAAFPHTPFVFLYRDPIAVMQSQETEPGSLTIPGAIPHFLGISDNDAVPGLDFAALVIARICSAAVDHAATMAGPFIDYAEMPGALWTRVLPHFQISVDLAAEERIALISKLDAKRPNEKFDKATRETAENASGQIIEVVQRHLSEPISRLRELTARQLG